MRYFFAIEHFKKNSVQKIAKTCHFLSRPYKLFSQVYKLNFMQPSTM